jgi:four helix bundle protein
LPRGRGHLADQLTRASISIVLNIAEGAGKYSGPDKRRYDLSALGSTTESAAIFDVLLRLKLTDDDAHRGVKQMLERIAAMLVKLAKRHERR